MPEVKRRELQVRSKDTFDAIQWHKLGDHPAVGPLPPGTSSYATPPNVDVTTLGWIKDPVNPSIGQSVSPGDYIIGPMFEDNGDEFYEVLSAETFAELYEEVPSADLSSPAEEPAPKTIKKGLKMKS